MAKTTGSCSSLKTKVLLLDSYGRPFSFMLPNGQKMYKSLIGAILTVIAVTLVAFYAIYKWDLLLSQEETSVQTNVAEGANTGAFTRDQGFNFAVAIGSIAQQKGPRIEEVDKSYGTIIVTQRTIGNTTERPMRQCRSSDIAPRSVIKEGHDSPDEFKSLIYPPNSALIDIYEDYGLAFCLHDDVSDVDADDSENQLFLKGSPGKTDDWSSVFIHFEPCTSQIDTLDEPVGNATVCRSAEEIDSWLEEKSFYIILNEQRFQSSNTNQPVKYQSQVLQLRIKSFDNIKYPIKYKKLRLTLSDSVFSIGQLLATRLDAFVAEQLPFEARSFTEGVSYAAVQFTVDTDLTNYTRTAYAFLDYLRDIGGLFGAFNAIFTGIVLVLNFDGMYQWLSSILFRVQSLKEHTDLHARKYKANGGNAIQVALFKSFASKISATIDKNSSTTRYQNVNWNVLSSLVLNIKRVLPNACRIGCCKETTRDRMFKRGFQKFKKEIQITELIKTIRILKAHAKKSFSQIQWRLHKLQKGTRKLHLLPNTDKQSEQQIFKVQPFTRKQNEVEPVEPNEKPRKSGNKRMPLTINREEDKVKGLFVAHHESQTADKLGSFRGYQQDTMAISSLDVTGAGNNSLDVTSQMQLVSMQHDQRQKRETASYLADEVDDVMLPSYPSQMKQFKRQRMSMQESASRSQPQLIVAERIKKGHHSRRYVIEKDDHYGLDQLENEIRQSELENSLRGVQIKQEDQHDQSYQQDIIGATSQEIDDPEMNFKKGE